VIGSYLPGSSPLHRAPAGVKLLLLLAVGAGAALLDRAWQVGVALLIVLACYRLAGFTWRTPVDQLRPLAAVLGFVAVFHVAVNGWSRAAEVVGMVLVLVLLAGLVTLTTRTSALVDVVVALARPLRPMGVKPERLGLVLALGIRSVPVAVGLAQEVRDAQRARGLTASPRAFAVPLVIRSLRHADTLGEALVARGVDDD